MPKPTLTYLGDLPFNFNRLERFWAKVNRNGPLPELRPDLGPCWCWTAAKNHRGYGNFGLGGKPQRMGRASRLSYELVIGPVPYGLELDHLCRNRGCVNPFHMEPVTHAENMARTRGLPHERRAA